MKFTLKRYIAYSFVCFVLLGAVLEAMMSAAVVSSTNSNMAAGGNYSKNCVYNFLMQSANKLPLMDKWTLDLTEDFRKAMVNDSFSSVAGCFHELDPREYVSNPKPNSEYWFGLDAGVFKSLSLPAFASTKDYTFYVELRYRADHDYDVITAFIVDKTAYP